MTGRRDGMAGLADRGRIVVQPEVARALASGTPVVALESTIITHGMPHPANVETARAVEQIVRDGNAVPATIAVLDGQVHVGLDAGGLNRIARAESVVKASSRDLAVVLARGGHAGTTVSATMRIAALAGIPVFATGGIGGVHRGAEASLDISADLTELGQTPVAVVCAGVKSILDIPRTLEVLETLRVPVIGHGTDDFPAFFSRSSGCACEQRLDTAADIAAAFRLHQALGSGTGMVIANPIPAADAIDSATIDAEITHALSDAAAQGVSGKDVTPFLLARINTLTGGQSLRANIALVRSNAALAARIAVALAERKSSGPAARPTP